MEQTWIDRWNNRYGNEAFAYGEDPNNYLREQLDKLTPGSILFPAEGEGRNAVYAAGRGWTVSAFDISTEGQKKAQLLSARNGVEIDYRLGGIEVLDFQPAQFDAIALIYAHFPANLKSAYHHTLSTYLKSGGIVIFEAFSKKHLDYLMRNEKVGGPRDLASLFSMEDIRDDFPAYDFIELAEQEIDLQEGLYHNGTGSVIRFVARKK